MFLSKTSEYALQLVLSLALQPRDEFIPIRSLADQTGISYFQLGKVAQRLIKANILHSYTGPHGGVALSKSPAKISLSDIVSAIDGPVLFDRCVLGLAGCSEAAPCAIHDHWKSIKESIKDLFNDRTLDELLDQETRRSILDSQGPALVEG
ncbi:MAG: Rrf2 family transcriptional regulator [Candidatus Neomarinimicrobiota bacterium]